MPGNALRRLFFPPLLLSPCTSSFAGYLEPLLFGELLGAGISALFAPEPTEFYHY
jgi:hypothetical protein